MNDMFTGLILYSTWRYGLRKETIEKKRPDIKEIMMRAERIPEALTEGLWGLI